MAADEARLLGGGAGAPGPARLDSEGSEEEEEGVPAEGVPAGWSPKMLPHLGLGSGAGGNSHAAASAAAALDLLPEEDSGGSSPGAPGGPGSARSRLSVSSASGLEGPGAGDSSGRGVRFGGASTIPAHHGGAPRPGSARRTTGSGNALLKKQMGAGAGGADVLVVEPAARLSWQEVANDF